MEENEIKDFAKKVISNHRSTGYDFDNWPKDIKKLVVRSFIYKRSNYAETLYNDIFDKNTYKIKLSTETFIRLLHELIEILLKNIIYNKKDVKYIDIKACRDIGHNINKLLEYLLVSFSISEDETVKILKEEIKNIHGDELDYVQNYDRYNNYAKDIFFEDSNFKNLFYGIKYLNNLCSRDTMNSLSYLFNNDIFNNNLIGSRQMCSALYLYYELENNDVNFDNDTKIIIDNLLKIF